MIRLFLVLLTTCAYILAPYVHGLCETDFIRNKTCTTTYGTTMVTNNLPSVISCARECAANDSCSSALYDHDSNACTTNSGVLSTLTAGCSTQLTYVEKIAHACSSTGGGPSTIGQACTSSADCTTPLSDCYASVCRCDSGYSYNPSNNSCIGVCTNYGTTYQHEIGALIVGFADITLSNVSLAGCWDACLAETTFVCVTAEYWKTSNPKKCYLSVESVYTQPSSYSVNADYDILQRDCAP